MATNNTSSNTGIKIEHQQDDEDDEYIVPRKRRKAEHNESISITS